MYRFKEGHKTLRYRWARANLSASAGADEMELWPELIWLMASLVRAGCAPATVFGYLLDHLRQIDNVEKFVAECSTADDERALYLASSENSLAVLQARADQRLFLAACYKRAHAGFSLDGATEYLDLKRQHSSQRTQQLLACWRVSETTGAPLGLLLENLAAHCENDTDAYEARTSAFAGPKATGTILSWLPLLGLGLGILMGTNPLAFLLGSVPGVLIGALGVGLAIYGRRWTSHLVTRAERLEFT